MKRFASASLAIELTFAVLIALIVSNAATFFLLDADRAREIRGVRVGAAEERLSAIVGLLPQLPQSAQADLIRATSVRGERMEIGDAPWVETGEPRNAEAEARLREAFDNQGIGEIRVVFLEPEEGSRARSGDRDRSNDQGDRADQSNRERRRVLVERFVVSVELAPGRWLNSQYAIPRAPSLLPVLLTSAGIAALTLAIAAIWMGYRVAVPLRRLSEASTAMRLGEPAPVIAESGPQALREAVSAFNAMSQRLMSTLEGQRTLLAAIAHDLRTPITALKLRCEFIEDLELRERMLATLDELQTTTEAALEAARAEGGGEPRRAVDVASLVESTATDMADLGAPVTCETEGVVTAMCRPGEIRRAVRNLIENAIRYGTQARVTIAKDEGDVVITVTDKGRGIPPDQIESVFQPFSRLETSRSRETGGHGLGLTIARAIARSHGGDVVLVNLPEGGLGATLRFPAGR